MTLSVFLRIILSYINYQREAPLDSLSLRGPTSCSVTSTRSTCGSPFLLEVLDASTSSANSMYALSGEFCGLSLTLDEERIAIAR